MNVRSRHEYIELEATVAEWKAVAAHAPDLTTKVWNALSSRNVDDRDETKTMWIHFRIKPGRGDAFIARIARAAQGEGKEVTDGK